MEYTISYPKRFSEFDIQAELYMALRLAGYNVRGEVRSQVHDLGHKHRVRLDLVVFDTQNQPHLIIECKDTFNGSFDLCKNTRQGRRYHSFGLPIVRIAKVEHFPALIETLVEDHEARLESGRPALLNKTLQQV